MFSIDLKSSKKITQSIINNWINNNQNYKPNNWEINILSKRIIAWISNSQITYEGSDNNYKLKITSCSLVQTVIYLNQILLVRLQQQKGYSDFLIGHQEFFVNSLVKLLC